MSDTPMHNTWDIQAWLQRKEEKALERVLQMVGTLQRLGPEQCEELKAIVADVERWRLEVDLVVKLNTAIDDMNALTDEDRKARFDSLDAGTAERLGDLVDRLGECGRRLTKLTREERHDMEGILSRLLGQSAPRGDANPDDAKRVDIKEEPVPDPVPDPVPVTDGALGDWAVIQQAVEKAVKGAMLTLTRHVAAALTNAATEAVGVTGKEAVAAAGGTGEAAAAAAAAAGGTGEEAAAEGGTGEEEAAAAAGREAARRFSQTVARHKKEAKLANRKRRREMMELESKEKTMRARHEEEREAARTVAARLKLRGRHMVEITKMNKEKAALQQLHKTAKRREAKRQRKERKAVLLC